MRAVSTQSVSAVDHVFAPGDGCGTVGQKGDQLRDSSGRPGRPIGMPQRVHQAPARRILVNLDALARRSINACAAVVSMNPGATVLTHTMAKPRWKGLASWSRPPRQRVRQSRFKKGMRAEWTDMNDHAAVLQHPRQKSRSSRTAASKLSFKARCHSRLSASDPPPADEPPTLLTRMSTPPNARAPHSRPCGPPQCRDLPARSGPRL